jgi:hypothetical protein
MYRTTKQMTPDAIAGHSSKPKDSDRADTSKGTPMSALLVMGEAFQPPPVKTLDSGHFVQCRLS